MPAFCHSCGGTQLRPSISASMATPHEHNSEIRAALGRPVAGFPARNITRGKFPCLAAASSPLRRCQLPPRIHHIVERPEAEDNQPTAVARLDDGGPCWTCRRPETHAGATQCLSMTPDGGPRLSRISTYWTLDSPGSSAKRPDG